MSELNGTLLDAAKRYLQRGWMPVFIEPGRKRPTHTGWQHQRLTESDLPAHFSRPGNIGLILGAASGGLTDVDLDCPEAIELADQFLPATPAVTGRLGAPRSHRWFIADVPSTKQFRDPETREMIVELRSTGGQTLVGPSIHESGEPYDCLEGEPAQVPGPMLAACVHALYDEVVRRRHGEQPQRQLPAPPAGPPRTDEPDLEALELRAVAYLEAMPPAISGQGGHNATYTAATVLVHGFGIPADQALQLLLTHYNPRCQPPWSEKELRHKVEDAASKPHEKPFGWLRDQETPSDPQDVDLSAFLLAAVPREESPPGPADPGPLPEEALRIPGFISEVQDYCLYIAPYPNQAMAFGGALSLLAFLAGRKVRDPGDNRTNIYLLGLAHASVGKNEPRKINMDIAYRVGLAACVGDRFASGEGVQDALFTRPSMLFQTDEVDGMLQSINKARDARHENIMSTLLTMYSSANTVYPMRRKAGKEWPGVIDQPNLVLFGTATPNCYYEALSERMLTNGFFARMLILEANPRGDGQEPGIGDLPPRVLATAKWWADYQPGTGNLENWHPLPTVVEQTEEARRLLIENRLEANAEYTRAEQASDPVGTTVWGRVSEQVRKLALIYAASENHESPRIGLAAVQWATRFVMHQTRRMLFMASQHVVSTEFQGLCKKALRFLRQHRTAGQARDYPVPDWKLRRHLAVPPKIYDSVVEALQKQEEILFETIPGKTKPRSGWKLL